MKTYKRIVAVALSVVLILGLFVLPASATSANDSSVFLHQNTTYTCTLASVAMMYRRHALLSGSNDWASITENAMRPSAWRENVGIYHTISYRGLTAVHRVVAGNIEQKKAYFATLLSAHPEGVVCYQVCGNTMHAVLLTDYDAATGTFYCADPAKQNPSRIPLANSTLLGNTQNAVFDYYLQVWYITKGAKQEGPICTVTFDPNGGNVSQTSKKVVAGQQIGDTPTATRAGYTLVGWTFEKDAWGGLVVADKNAGVYITEDTKLYALWRGNKYTVNLDADGGDCISSITVQNGRPYYDLPAPTRDGYTFDGWYTSANDGKKITTSTTVDLTADQTLYARWTADFVQNEEPTQPERYTVYFDANEGSVSTSHKTVTQGEKYGSLPTPVWQGYTFDGWYTDIYTGYRVWPSDTVDLNGDQTLYAQWIKDPEPAPEPEPDPEPYWGSWSDWQDAEVSASSTRQVETREVKVAPARTEYRYGRWVNSEPFDHFCPTAAVNSGHRNDFRLDYTAWSETRLIKYDLKWFCTDRTHNHQHCAARNQTYNGKTGDVWHGYKTSANATADYYWEETRTVPATYKTQYRYRDLHYGS